VNGIRRGEATLAAEGIELASFCDVAA
jgi:hypothetical protein